MCPRFDHYVGICASFSPDSENCLSVLWYGQLQDCSLTVVFNVFMTCWYVHIYPVLHSVPCQIIATKSAKGFVVVSFDYIGYYVCCMYLRHCVCTNILMDKCWWFYSFRYMPWYSILSILKLSYMKNFKFSCFHLLWNPQNVIHWGFLYNYRIWTLKFIMSVQSRVC